MRISPVVRAACAYVASTLVFSLSLAPSFAHMSGPAGAPFVRPAFGFRHFQHFAPHGFNRRFDDGRLSFDRFGFSRFNRFGFNRFDRNQLFVGGGWGLGWDGYPVSAAASEPTVVSEGTPVIINIGADPASRAAGGYGGGCVIHKLIYNSDGKYVGERQFPQC